MDRKALIAIIAPLTLLVVLLLVYYDQQAMAPMTEPTISATASGPIRPSVAGILDIQGNSSFSMNLTNTTVESATPSALATPHHNDATTTPVPPTSTPKPSAMTPWPPMSPMAPAPTLSWDNTLRH